MGNILGVDLGGTSIRTGKIENSIIVGMTVESTPSLGTEPEVLDKIFSTIDKCIDSETRAIGVGVPSVVDVEKGIVYDVVHIPSWKVVHLKDILEEKYNLPAFINNDANCFATAEKYFGKGKTYQSIVGMAIGTGLGLGLIFNGKLYEGRNCGAGEFGMLPYLDNNFEYYCSGQFFKSLKSTDGGFMYEKALNGDKEAIMLFDEFGRHMGQVIKSILYAYDPEIIILGGSLSKAFPFFNRSMMGAIQDFAYRNVLANLKIEVSELENSAVYGAAALYMNSIHNS